MMAVVLHFIKVKISKNKKLFYSAKINKRQILELCCKKTNFASLKTKKGKA